MNLTTLRKSFHRFNSSTLSGAEKRLAFLPVSFLYIPYPLLPDGMTLEILHESVLVAVADRDMRSVAHEDDRALDFLDLMHIDHI